MFSIFLSRWVLSQAKKEGIDEEIAKYDGKFHMLFHFLLIWSLEKVWMPLWFV